MTDNNPNIRIAIFPGSFRPFTIGHADIVARGLDIFDRIIIAAGVNPDKPVSDTDAADFDAIVKAYQGNDRVEVVRYSSLTIDLAQKYGADFILRGVRSVKDFEYERDMAEMNRQLSGIETVILFSAPQYAAISSSVVRELRNYGHDISQFIP